MAPSGDGSEDEDTTDSERRHQPELSRSKPVEPKQPFENEFEIDPRDDADEDAARLSRMNQTMRQVARQASLDPGDGIELYEASWQSLPKSSACRCISNRTS